MESVARQQGREIQSWARPHLGPLSREEGERIAVYFDELSRRLVPRKTNHFYRRNQAISIRLMHRGIA